MTVQVSSGLPPSHVPLQVLQRAERERILPPHHPGAKTLNEAYVVDEIIPPSILDEDLEVSRLIHAASNAAAQENLRNGGISAYVFSRLYLLLDQDRAKVRGDPLLCPLLMTF